MDTLTLAKSAYHAYGAVTDFKNYEHKPMPLFEKLPPKIQKAWGEAALDVLNNAAAALMGQEPKVTVRPDEDELTALLTK